MRWRRLNPSIKARLGIALAVAWYLCMVNFHPWSDYKANGVGRTMTRFVWLLGERTEDFVATMLPHPKAALDPVSGPDIQRIEFEGSIYYFPLDFAQQNISSVLKAFSAERGNGRRDIFDMIDRNLRVGQAVKANYPSSYDDITDQDLGRKATEIFKFGPKRSPAIPAGFELEQPAEIPLHGILASATCEALLFGVPYFIAWVLSPLFKRPSPPAIN